MRWVVNDRVGRSQSGNNAGLTFAVTDFVVVVVVVSDAGFSENRKYLCAVVKTALRGVDGALRGAMFSSSEPCLASIFITATRRWQVPDVCTGRRRSAQTTDVAADRRHHATDPLSRASPAETFHGDKKSLLSKIKYRRADSIAVNGLSQFIYTSPLRYI